MEKLLILTLLILLLPVVSKGYAVINVYYNGTVIAHLYNESRFNIIGNYMGGLKVIGSQYNFTNDQILLSNGSNVIIEYQASFKGVISVKENYNFSLNIILPSNVTLNYISTQPSKFSTVGNTYNISFNNVNNVLVLYSGQALQPSVKTQPENFEFYLIIVLVIADLILISLLVRFLMSRREKIKGEGDVNPTFVTEVLDERDKLVLDAIKNGATTLSDIIAKSGLPKATAYRRVKKLVGLGYIEEIRDKGKVYYKLKDNEPKAEG